MFRGMWRWFWWGNVAAGGIPNGTFRRHLAGRVFRWRSPLVSNQMPVDICTKTVREADWFLFDFSKTAPVRAGWTLVNPTIHTEAGVTVGTPVVSDIDFAGVPAGQGVLVQFSDGDEDVASYAVSCTVTATDGSRTATLETPGRLVVASTGTGD